VQPLVTTVIPAFNAERFLAATIESALAQDHDPHEVIVVDDGSTDATPEIVGHFEGARYMRQENGGPAAARNAGTAAAAGEMVCCLDHDDLMPPGRLRRQVSYLLEHPTSGVVLGRQELLVEPGVEPPEWARRPRLPAPGSGSMEPNDNPFYPVCTALTRSWVFDRVGYFDLSFRIAADVDWLFRILDAGIEVGMLDEVFLVRRLHGANLTYDTAGNWSDMVRILKARIDRKRSGATPAQPGP